MYQTAHHSTSLLSLTTTLGLLTTMTHSVLLVEDQAITRHWLAQAIDDHCQLALIGAADCLKTASKMLDELKPDVLLTDLKLPDGSGIDLIRTCQKTSSCQSLVITALRDEAHVFAAIEAGARGYLLKSSTTEQISNAVIAMLDGGSPISPAAASYLLNRCKPLHKERSGCKTNTPSLTNREQQVLGLIAKGHSYGDIAAKLFVSIHTVNSHIKQLYRKLAVRSRGQAVYEATQMGLLRTNE